ncbi:MAG: transcription elongation factor GreA [Proteobacteria bacterium]|nr:transcription elongation factor GreA [Pseudomonadota bacterium]|tara:strand:+ start:1728 stop:2204 length:477 start_codon:yes stop_codon:yes gene_type:complete
MNKIPLTKNGAEMLRSELSSLKTVDRPAVIEAIKEARAHGDLSENAEYDAAKEKQSFIEGRILELESKLASAEIIDPSTIDSDGRCVFGATVKIKNLASEQVVTYQIVGEDEADIKKGKVSIKSPIARGLIGKTVGDVAEVVAPVGGVEYEVLSITFV